MTDLSLPMRLQLQHHTYFGRLPATLDERRHDAAALTGALARTGLGAWAFLLGGYSASWLGAVGGVLTLLAGCMVGVALAAVCALPCNAWGVDPVDAAKPAFGQRGALAVLGLFGAGQVAWAGLMLTMFGRGVQNVMESLGMLSPQMVGRDAVVSLMVLLGALLAFTLVVRGTRGLGWARGLALPSVIVVGLLTYYGVLRDLHLRDLARIPPLQPMPDTRRGFLAAFELALGAGFTAWPSVGRLVRHARSQQTSLYAPVLVLGVGVALLAGGGHLAALFFRNFDPTLWLTFLSGHAFGLVTLALVTVTNVLSAATLLRSAAGLLRHVRPLRRLGSTAHLALVTLPLFMFVLKPRWLYEHFGVGLRVLALVYAPVCAVQAVDALALRRMRVNLSQLYEAGPTGLYYFWGGVNGLAVMAAAAGWAVAFFLEDPITGATHPWARPLGAAGPAFLVAAAAHGALGWALMRLSERGGYHADGAPLPLVRIEL